MLSSFRRALMPALFIATGLAHADETAVQKGIDAFLGAPAVESVAKVPYGDLYEVVLKSGELIYTDGEQSFIIDGQIIDAKSRRNITQLRISELQRIDFASLPFEDAIKQVRGDGTRQMATFEDPNCGYCKRLAEQLRDVDNVTIYTFMVPILTPDSETKARNIWCAEDRAASWNSWMVDGNTPASADCDSSSIDKNSRYARKLGVNGTPTIFFADGNRVSGYLPATEIEKALSLVAGSAN